jgi:excisionase family DNA binding protein
MAAYTWLTARQVAAELQLGHSTVCEKAAKGVLPATRIDGSWRFRRDLLDAYLAQRTQVGKTIAERQPVSAPTLVPPPSDDVTPIFKHRPWAEGRAVR